VVLLDVDVGSPGVQRTWLTWPEGHPTMAEVTRMKAGPVDGILFDHSAGCRGHARHLRCWCKPRDSGSFQSLHLGEKKFERCHPANISSFESLGSPPTFPDLGLLLSTRHELNPSAASIRCSVGPRMPLARL